MTWGTWLILALAVLLVLIGTHVNLRDVEGKAGRLLMALGVGIAGFAVGLLLFETG